MQRETTALLSQQSGLESISLRHFDCIVFQRGEVMKMFAPRTRRVIGGTPKDRMLTGYLLLAFQTDLTPLRPPSKRFDLLNKIAQVHLMNFPRLISLSALQNDTVDPRLLNGISALLAALPSNREDWHEFFEVVPDTNKLSRLVEYLRGIDLTNLATQ